MQTKLNEKIAELTKFVKRYSSIVVFTGAGISTESGISDYRSKGGIWDRFQPVTIQEFLADENKRRLYWQRKRELLHQMGAAKPNDAHLAIAQLEKRGKLHGLITQNIDGLHQAAGVREEKVVEIHGTNRETVCLSCNAKIGWEETLKRLEAGEEALLCKKCAGLLKPNTISFGQSLDPRTMEQADRWTESCDAMLVIGSTLIVEPAASFPRLAKARGAALAIVNLTATPQDEDADLVIHAKAGEVLPKAIAMSQ